MRRVRDAYSHLKRCKNAFAGSICALSRTNRCPLCGTRRQRLEHVTDRYYYLSCPRCQLVYVGNAPSEDELIKWYRGRTFQEQRNVFHCSTGGAETEWDTWLEFKTGLFRELGLDTQASKSTPRLLDVGCGEGLLLGLFRKQGWQVKGIELNPVMAARLQRKGFAVSQEPLADYQDSTTYDLILMFHVIEHLRHPFRDLAKVRSLLAGDGQVILETPVSRNYSCTDHVSFFNSSNLGESLFRSGLTPIRSYQYVDVKHPEFMNLCVRCVPITAGAAHVEATY